MGKFSQVFYILLNIWSAFIQCMTSNVVLAVPLVAFVVSTISYFYNKLRDTIH